MMVPQGSMSRFGIAGQMLRVGFTSVRFFFACLCLPPLGCQEPARTVIDLGGHHDQEPTMLTNEEAIAIARQAIKGKTKLQKGSPVTIQRKGGACVVTFVHINPPGTLGPDYDARVTIDTQTRTVTELLGGS